ncbi:MAG: zinc metalloprotease HtpX [Planctomycetota bacterium]|nr:MAG: zinc metalloprotease HtpX [Planctomycetota bacterium]
MEGIFDAIARNKRNTWLLIMAFAGLIFLIGWVFGWYWGSPWMGLALGAVIGVVLTVTAYYSGSKALLFASRAKQIEKKDAPQLFNVVEEMSIAAGLPMPKVYIINDTAPNAFATGRDEKHAAVAVTAGLLQKLNRDELQGVIAHEMSHIGNRDILFAMMMGVLVGLVALLCDAFLYSMWLGGGRRRSSRNRRGGGAEGIIMLVGLLLAILAPIFAKILQLAVSRQREYLADATAVRLTRNPEGLARALEKISSDREVLEVANRATQHLYIVNPIKRFEKRAKSMFSTHPPVKDRIRRIRSLR